MKTVEITLRISYDDTWFDPPELWKWSDLVGDTVEVVDSKVVS